MSLSFESCAVGEYVCVLALRAVLFVSVHPCLESCTGSVYPSFESCTVLVSWHPSFSFGAVLVSVYPSLESCTYELILPISIYQLGSDF